MASNCSMDTTVTNKKKGENIVNKIQDPQAFCNQFITYYFQNIVTGKSFNMLREFTTFKYNNFEYKHAELVKLLQQMNGMKPQVKQIQILPSGSRRFDIMITGEMNKKNFSQYFMLTHEKKNDWYIKSSIIILN